MALAPLISNTVLTFQITANKMQLFLIYLFSQTLYMFQAVPLPIIRMHITMHGHMNITILMFCLC